MGSNLLTSSTDGRNAAARLTNNEVAALADPLSVPGAEWLGTRFSPALLDDVRPA